MNLVYLLLGGNVGNRVQLLETAIRLLREQAGPITAISGWYETAAWGKKDQPDFLNIAVELQTELDPEQVLDRIQHIEKELGRQRSEVWGQRTLDIDILFFNNQQINSPELQVPHPYLQDRRFVLVPLCDIAPELVHPVLQHTVRELLAICPDPLEVRQFQH